ncbi:nucleotidyltransferase domain-containing protein [Magnetovibrio blakemorei]|nr:nucleotidyltransferase domain-containing protein [Magnetovibrio blakemorei]
MENNSLERLATIVAEWAEQFPILKTVYIFGSHVRGDHHAESDFDVALEFDLLAGSSEETPFDKELISGCAGLKALLPSGIKLQVTKDSDDAAWPNIRAGECVFTTGKTQCVITPRRKPQRT